MPATDFKYELFFDLSPDLLCIAGYDGYFKKVNAAVSQTLGYSFEELYGRPINDFVTKEDQEITASVRQELTKAKPLHNFENRYRTKAGEIVWLSWTSLPVESDQLIFAVAKNVTHKKRLEAERNTLLANLTQVNKDLQQATYTTSHDLRAPVNNLLSLFHLIDTSRVSDQDTREFFEVLKAAGEKLKHTLENYLDLLKEKHNSQATIEEIDLQESLDNVLRSISSLVHTANATIHHDFSAAGKIRFNAGYLKSVFLNLITNSIKYAQPDRLPLISIHTEKDDRFIHLIIADNGRGFDMEKAKDDIFGFHQKFHDHADSKGIGLYLVYNHVTSLGGKIKAESRINNGTKFTISFRI